MNLVSMDTDQALQRLGESSFPCRGGNRRREIERRCASQTTPGISETSSRTDRHKPFIDSRMPRDHPFFREDLYDSSVSGGSEALRERGIV
jgi:hypothetical protein